MVRGTSTVKNGKIACSLLALPEAVAWVGGGRWHWRQVMTAGCPGLHAGSLPVLLPLAETPAQPQTGRWPKGMATHVHGWGKCGGSKSAKAALGSELTNHTDCLHA